MLEFGKYNIVKYFVHSFKLQRGKSLKAEVTNIIMILAVSINYKNSTRCLLRSAIIHMITHYIFDDSINYKGTRIDYPGCEMNRREFS